MVIKIGRALQESRIDGKVVRFDEQGKRVEDEQKAKL